MNPKVIAYDLGTGGIKASLVHADGTIIQTVFVAYETSYPLQNRQEQAPEEWWQAVISSTRMLLDKTNILPSDITALAISGHSLGVVPIGKDGTLLREKTPIWSDQRATAQANNFFSAIDYKDWYMHTGNGFPPACYSIFKIMWYKDNEPEMFARIHKVVGTKDYCNYRFTGRLCTDYSYASGSGVFNLKEWEYNDEYIRASGISKDILPEIITSDATVGTITPEASAATGLPAHVKVICGGVDNSCMALGAKGIASGRVYTSLGSSAWIALISENPVLDFTSKPYVFSHVIKGMYTSATCIFSAGSSFQWVRNTFCQDMVQQERQGGKDAYTVMNEFASQSVEGASGLLFNPSLAGGSMLDPSPDICGAFTGLRLKHTRNDIIRATMEGIALNLKIAFDLLHSYHPGINEMLFVGGGAKSLFWMQLFASIYGIPVEKTSVDQEAASLGAAALALKGTGLWSDYSPIDTLHIRENYFNPDYNAQKIYQDTILPRFKTLTNLLAQL